MDRWHSPYAAGDDLYKSKVCHVCLAGSVMAQTLGAKPDDWLFPASYKSSLAAKLNALDCFRIGQIYSGIFQLARLNSNLIGLTVLYPKRVPITSYSKSPKKFKSDMRKLAKTLRKIEEEYSVASSQPDIDR